MEFKYLDREFSLYREHEAQTTQRVGQKLLKVEVKKVLNLHMAGQDKDNIIWPILMLELWARTWLD
jgi:hypothetical protein